MVNSKRCLRSWRAGERLRPDINKTHTHEKNCAPEEGSDQQKSGHKEDLRTHLIPLTSNAPPDELSPMQVDLLHIEAFFCAATHGRC